MEIAVSSKNETMIDVFSQHQDCLLNPGHTSFHFKQPPPEATPESACVSGLKKIFLFSKGCDGSGSALSERDTNSRLVQINRMFPEVVKFCKQARVTEAPTATGDMKFSWDAVEQAV